MTAIAKCKVLGRWRIFFSDIWGGSDLDMAGPATITIGEDGYGELSIGCLEATLFLEYGRSIVFFRLQGCDEGTEMTGSGSAELGDDGTLEVEISFDNGDDALLTARRE